MSGEVTYRQRRALMSVRYATVQHVLAVRAGDVDDAEIEELGRQQAQAARRAIQAGCNVDAVAAATRRAVEVL